MELRLADIGEGTTEAEILRWLVREGEVVEEYAPLVEIQTDKVTTEVPSPMGGVVRRIHVREGQVVPVGTVLCEIEGVGQEEAAPASAPFQQPVPTAPAAAGKLRRRVLASPATRRRALELGIDLVEVPGTGPGGRVTMADLESFQASRATAARGEGAHPTRSGTQATPLPSEEVFQRVPLQGVRRVIARRMEESHRSIPAALHLDDCDVTELMRLRQELNAALAAEGEHLTVLPWVMKAVALALRRHPRLNAHFDEQAQELQLYRPVHIGIATDSAEGLLLPVVRHVEQKSIRGLGQELMELLARARRGELPLADQQGATFSITNHGALGGLYGVPLIPPPQVALLGLGRIREEPRVVAGTIAVRSVLHYSLAFDHRVLDGADVIRFCHELVAYLEHPERFLAELT